jgi:hypothetical protein
VSQKTPFLDHANFPHTQNAVHTLNTRSSVQHRSITEHSSVIPAAAATQAQCVAPSPATEANSRCKIAMDDFEAAAKRQTHLIIDNVLEQLQVKVNEKLIERLKAPSDTMTMESNATLRKAAANYETLYNELDTVFNRLQPLRRCIDPVSISRHPLRRRNQG